MATYEQIRRYVIDRHGFRPMNGSIADVKEMCGLPVRRAANRKDANRLVYACPEERAPAIKDALRYFGMI